MPTAVTSDPSRATHLRTHRGLEVALPLFLPVYDRRASLVSIDGWEETFGVEGCICNAFFLYKDRALRKRFRDTDLTLAELLDYDGVLMTDSGAFQGFSGKLFLENKKIVPFQDRIGADIISPLDLVTPPGDNRSQAAWKLDRTIQRITEAKRLTEHAILAGVQQGGRFLDLRQKSLDALLPLDLEYLALGSLVPFFNRNHDLGFVGEVIRQARHTMGPTMPIHVYGAGDPLELPFLFRHGADIFDSASYGHYAQGGWYMTPYGALKRHELARFGEQWACPCPTCAEVPERDTLFDDERDLASHNLHTIFATVRLLRRLGRGPALDAHLTEVTDRHQAWFPESALARSVARDEDG